uniref:Uncharacterized protein n=1 Tax=Romanomermis culicivorax TaxID=13658 RepID=A0A915JLT2_ROMCU
MERISDCNFTHHDTNPVVANFLDPDPILELRTSTPQECGSASPYHSSFRPYPAYKRPFFKSYLYCNYFKCGAQFEFMIITKIVSKNISKKSNALTGRTSRNVRRRFFRQRLFDRLTA